MGFNYFSGYKTSTDRTKLITTVSDFNESLNEIHENKSFFGPHFNSENYNKFGPLRECKTFHIVENVEPKNFSKESNIKFNENFIVHMPETMSLLGRLIKVINADLNNLGRAYITILEKNKNILRHSDTAAQYFNLIKRYQFYYTGGDNIIKIINSKNYPVVPGYLYFFDHHQQHEYMNHSNDDLILMVFDIFKD